jgi:hypothetical protein
MFTPHVHGTSPAIVMSSTPGLGPLYRTLIAGVALAALFLAAMSAYTARHLLVPQADPEAEAAPLLPPAPGSPLLAVDEKAAPPPQIIVSTSTSFHTLESLEDLRAGVHDPAHDTPIAPRC